MALGKKFNQVAKRYEKRKNKPDFSEAWEKQDYDMMRYLLESGKVYEQHMEISKKSHYTWHIMKPGATFEEHKKSATAHACWGFARDGLEKNDIMPLKIIHECGVELDQYWIGDLLEAALAKNSLEAASLLSSMQTPDAAREKAAQLVESAGAKKKALVFLEKSLGIDLRDYAEAVLGSQVMGMLQMCWDDKKADKGFDHLRWLVETKGIDNAKALQSLADQLSDHISHDNAESDRAEDAAHVLDRVVSYLEKAAKKSAGRKSGVKPAPKI